MKTKLLLTFIIFIFINTGLSALVYDIEAVRFTKPDVIKADTGIFSDARYYMVGKTGEIGVLLRNKGDLNVTQNKIELKVYIEDSLGNFNKMVFDTSYHVDIASGDSIEVTIPMYEWPNSFIPQVYDELGKEFPANKIPLHFSTMLRNVTPRYKIVAKVQADQDTTNNTLTEVFRFYIQRSPFVLSVENSFADIENTSDPDLIAGKLNSDSLLSGLYKLGFYTDLFDRKGWEPNAVDYTIYDYLFWSDGHDKPLTEFEKSNITLFLDEGRPDDIKSFVICSQEALRQNYEIDSNWVKNTLNARKKSIYPTDPNEGKEYSTDDNSENYLIGDAIARGLKYEIKRTGFSEKDTGPLPGLVSLFYGDMGLSRRSFTYNPKSVICPEPKEISAGIATISVISNVIFIAVDWRHFGDNLMMQRGVLDFINKNNGHTLEYPPKRKYSSLYAQPSEVFKYRGDTLSYDILIEWGYSSSYYPLDKLICVQDNFNNTIDTISNTKDFPIKRSFIIPDTKPLGIYTIDLEVISSRPILSSVKGMKITILPDSAVISGDNSACQYDSVFYKLTGPIRTNSWSVIGSGEILTDNTGTEIKIYWPEPGENTVILQQTNQKTGEVKEYKYYVTVKPAPDKPTITQKGDTLFSSAETGNFWQMDGKTISGGADNYFVPQKSGKYTVRVTGENGCNSKMSDALDFILDVEDDITFSGFSIIPNPANDYTVITYNLSAPGFVSLKLYNSLGMEVYTLINEQQEAGNHKFEFRNGLVPGIYFYRFQCNNIQYSGKLLIIK